MITHNVEQGTAEWRAARAGVITASVAATCLETKRDGSPTKASEDLAFRLAVERVAGVPFEEQFDTWYMKRGRELEQTARDKYAAITGRSVHTAGFLTTDDGIIGCSPDGLCEDRGLEIKCFLDPVKLRSILIEDDLSDVYEQVQTCMEVTGLWTWDVVLYCPMLAGIGCDLTVRTMKRGADMLPHLYTFNGKVETLAMQLRRKLQTSASPF